MSTVIDRAATACLGISKLAARLGVSTQVVGNWRARGTPVEHCAAIEAATDRAVMRWDLRPDDWWRIWPELVGAAGAPPVPATSQQEMRDAA